MSVHSKVKGPYKSDVQKEPRTRSSDKDFTVLPLTEVMNKVLEAGLGRTLWSFFNEDLSVWGIEGIAEFCRSMLSADILDGISSSDLFVAANIESISNSFWDCQSKVQSSASRDGAKSVDDTPGFVESHLAIWAASGDK